MRPILRDLSEYLEFLLVLDTDGWVTGRPITL